jgi:hypothetical protein
MLRRICPIVLLTVALSAGASAGAQTPQTPAAQKPEKAPPPPLFPKHRRGVYVNGDQLEVIDATPQSPPLTLDDPGVPDKGEYEINLLTSADLGADARHVDVFTVDANYGVVLKGWGHELPAQLKLEAPIVANREGAQPYAVGLGDSAAGVKFNFYNDEHRGLRLSVYPQIEFSMASSVGKGVAEAGQTLMLPLLVSHESKYITLVGNAGVEQPFHDDARTMMADLGFGAGRAFFRKLAVMGEVFSSSTLRFDQERLVSTSAGVIYGVRNAIWYARVGHSLVSDDGRHTFVAFGMKVLIDTQHPAASQP